MMCLVTVREIKNTWSAQKIFEQEEVFVLIGPRRDTLARKYPVCENMNYSGTRI